MEAISLASFIYTDDLEDVAFLFECDKIRESADKLAFGAL
jgi:hypothetical protein